KGYVVQRLSMDAIGTKSVEFDLLLDLSIALTETTYPFEKDSEKPLPALLLERPAEVWNRAASMHQQWKVENPYFRLSAALFCDGNPVNFSICKEVDGLSAEGYSDIYGSLIYKRKIIIQPAQMVNYYLVLML